MKKVLLMVTLMLLFSTIGFASPLMDYSQGKVAVDFAIRPNLDFDWAGTGYDGKSGNYDMGLTIGLGNKFAFQYANQKADSKDYTLSGTTYSGSGRTEATGNQFNILYKLDKNFSVFAGYTNAKMDLVVNSGTVSLGGNTYSLSGTAGGKTINGYQIGFIAAAPMGDNLTGYAVAGFGSKIENFEIGLGYALAKNTELNVFYKSMKYKDLEFDAASGYKFDFKASGIGYGLTFKF